ncbi:hypothetical protein SADUNF_Sadunf04G0138000 [Salix dunnii]|uniref:Uncharacterized protein n=1 Tax=Salix dunnii TaxID=1413687 RepID=A0A835KF00_9ROSI|nr:hypothetical protein SADUNF_Sadunf04G0138000 [Salix dunnii]
MNAKLKTLVKKELARTRLEITSVDVHLANTVMVKQDVKELVISNIFLRHLLEAVAASFFLVIICLLLYINCTKRRKEKNFKKNGGKFLKNQRKSWTQQNSDETDYLLGETSQPPCKEVDQPILTPSQTVISFQIENYTNTLWKLHMLPDLPLFCPLGKYNDGKTRCKRVGIITIISDGTL